MSSHKCLLPLFALFALGASAESLLLDFGSEKSPLREGFTRQTQTALTSKGEISAREVPIEREWVYSESSGRNNPPNSYTNELSCDHLQSTAPATLRLPAPAGKYRLWFLCGKAKGNRHQVWDISASTNGGTKTATFAGGYEIRHFVLPATSDGALEISLKTRSRWVLNALIAVPENEWGKTYAEVITPLETEIDVLPPSVLAKWKETPHRDDSPMPDWTEGEKKKGLILHRRPWSECIWPNTVPRRRDIDREVRAFASLDEYEPMTFTLFPLRDFAEIDVQLTTFTADNGQTIPAENVDVRYVRYLNVRPNYRTYERYYRAPDVLMPWEPRPLVKGENLRLWLTVHSNPAARDAVYRSTASILANGRKIAELPLVMRIVPIHLQKDQSLIFGHYYHHPYRGLAGASDSFSKNWWWRKAKLEHQDMAAHGNNTLVLRLPSAGYKTGRWKFRFDTLGRDIDLYRSVGFDKPIICSIPCSSLYWKHMKKGMGSHLRLVEIPPPEFFRELTEMVRAIEAERKRRQWPELLYYPVDEPSRRQVSVAFMTGVMKAIKQVEGVRTYVTADPAHEEFEPMRPYVDVWCCQPFSIPRDELVADMEKRNVEYWCYPNHVAGENDHTTVIGARLTYGFGFWRSGFRALTPWIYQAIVGDQWNYLDGSAMDFFNRTADDGSPIPVTMWEAYREGIDDGRYITTLKHWIARARENGKTTAADAAQEDLDLVWKSIETQPKYKLDSDVNWDYETFDIHRWMLASNILAIKAALGE